MMERKKSKGITKRLKAKSAFNARKKGHFKKDCPELKNKKREQNRATATAEEEGYESARVCVATKHVQKGTCILDSVVHFICIPLKITY